MKIETIRKLDRLASTAASALKAEIDFGLTTQESIAAVKSKVKYPTRLEIIKAMIRSDVRRAEKIGCAEAGLRQLSNVAKTSNQLNYLAVAIDSVLSRASRKDEELREICRGMFGSESFRHA